MARGWWQVEIQASLLPAADCTPQPPGHGLPRAASTAHALLTRRPCCPTGRCWWRGDLLPAASLPARNCTIRPAGRGVPPATSTPHASFTRRRCCPTASCTAQEDETAV